jgi:hypothetical protein
MQAELRRETEAVLSLSEAIGLYAQWGAQDKAETLEAQRKRLTGE